jgi:hypothetical protein
MSTVQLDELEPGMVLAADAVCLNGRVLLRAGVALTEQHLKIFRTWGLSEADIEGADAEKIFEKKLADADPQIVEKERLALNERFRHADISHPLISELFRWCLEHAVDEARK